MIAMGMADEKDLRVAVLEAKALDARANQRHVLLVIRIDQDVPLRGMDQINREIGRAGVIKVARDLECGEGTMPFRIGLRQQRRRE